MCLSICVSLSISPSHFSSFQLFSPPSSSLSLSFLSLSQPLTICHTLSQLFTASLSHSLSFPVYLDHPRLTPNHLQDSPSLFLPSPSLSLPSLTLLTLPRSRDDYRPKAVKFADWMLPEEGTLPSEGEIHSLPPPLLPPLPPGRRRSSGRRERLR